MAKLRVSGVTGLNTAVLQALDLSGSNVVNDVPTPVVLTEEQAAAALRVAVNGVADGDVGAATRWLQQKLSGGGGVAGLNTGVLQAIDLKDFNGGLPLDPLTEEQAAAVLQMTDGDMGAATRWLQEKLVKGGVTGLNTAVSQVLGTQSED